MSKFLYKEQINDLVDIMVANGAEKNMLAHALTEVTLDFIQEVQDSNVARFRRSLQARNGEPKQP